MRSSVLFYEKHLPKGRYDSKIRRAIIVAIMKLFHKDRIFTKRINDMIDSYVAVHPEILMQAGGGQPKNGYSMIFFTAYTCLVLTQMSILLLILLTKTTEAEKNILRLAIT